MGVLRKVSFVFSIIGIALLLMLMLKGGAEIENLENLEEKVINQKVVLRGVVESIRDFGNFQILAINGIEVFCDVCSLISDSYEVEIEGIVSEYAGQKQIEVLRIRKE